VGTVPKTVWEQFQKQCGNSSKNSVGTVPKSVWEQFQKQCGNSSKNSVGTVPKSNRKIIERGKIYITNTQIHDYSFFWLGTDTSIKNCGLDWFHGTKPPLLVK
jgi:hypothetical protein